MTPAALEDAHGTEGKPASEISKMEAERRRTLPERPKPQRPEGFGQTVPTESTGGDRPPQRARPDVFVDAHAHVGRIEFTLDGLEAHVRLHAQVLDLLELSVGADASLDHVGLTIDDVQVDALVEVRLDAVEAIVVRLLETIDHHPEIIRDLTRGVGKAVENIGEGVGSGVEEIGEGVGSGVESIGKGVGEGVRDLGGGVGEGVKGLGEGVGEGVRDLGEGVGKGVENVGSGAGQAARGEGEDAGSKDGGDGNRRTGGVARSAAGESGDPPDIEARYERVEGQQQEVGDMPLPKRGGSNPIGETLDKVTEAAGQGDVGGLLSVEDLLSEVTDKLHDAIDSINEQIEQREKELETLRERAGEYEDALSRIGGESGEGDDESDESEDEDDEDEDGDEGPATP